MTQRSVLAALYLAWVVLDSVLAVLEWPFQSVGEISGTVSIVAAAASALVLFAAVLGRLQPRWVFLATSLVEMVLAGAMLTLPRYIALIGGSLGHIGQLFVLHMFIAVSYSGLLVLAVVGLVGYYRSTTPFPTSGRAILARMCALSPLLGLAGWYVAEAVAITQPAEVLRFLLAVPDVALPVVWMGAAFVSTVSWLAAVDTRERRQSLAGVVLNALLLLVVVLASALARH